MQSDQDINNADPMGVLALMMDPRATAKDSIDVLTAAEAKWQRCSETEGRNLLRQFEYQHPQAYRYARMKYGACTVAMPLWRLFKFGHAISSIVSNVQQGSQQEHELWEHVKLLSEWSAYVVTLVNYMRPYAEYWDAAASLVVLLNDPDVQELFTSTQLFEAGWTKEYKWAHDPGRVLHVHRCAQKVVVQLEQITTAISEIDALLSMVDAVERYRMCPVQFIESQQASVCAQQLWSIVLDPSTVVKNDVQLSLQSNKMLITGPNGGGKSTVMKSIGQAVVLAQSWGFAPANEFVCTPFTGIFVAMDSEQSLQANLSTFMSELQTLDRIKATVKEYTEREQHCLVILDEPCRGTIEIESAKRISQFCKGLDEYKNVAAVLATHMYDPAQVVESLHSWYNCQLGHRFVDDTVERTFELLPGVASWWFNDAEKREFFLHSLQQSMQRVG